MASRFLPRLLVALVVTTASAGCLDLLDRVQNVRAGPGDGAVDYLSDAKYKKLVVEIDSVKGAEPNSVALDRLKAVLSAHLTKPGGITYDTSGLGSIPAKSESKKYTLSELRDIENAHRSRHHSGDTAALYVLYVDGGYSADSEDGRVLGLVYHSTGLVMFKGNIKSITRGDGGLLPSWTAEERCVERAVLVHEMGHVLGLVNEGTPMTKAREDREHRGHSTNKESVMYYAVENSQNLMNVFSGGCSSIPHEFDADDKADLKAAGGK